MQESDKKSPAADHQMDLWRELRAQNMQHWRAWGSWFSWGSPIGLGLFFVLICGGVYILHLAGLIG